MIFYFSGTGNSKYVADTLAAHFGDELIEMCEDTIAKRRAYRLKDDERLGFVCPVYWYNMPIEVEKFIKCLKIENYKGQYAYCVVTYGRSSGHIMNQINKELKRSGISISGKYGITMVDNYVVAYSPVDANKQDKIITEAKACLKSYLPHIEQREKIEITNKGLIAFTTPILKPFYNNANHTRKFYTLDNCINCGKCERDCPSNVIKIVDGRPVWKGDCSFCLKCINACPVKAVQYGKGTLKHDRYLFHEGDN